MCTTTRTLLPWSVVVPAAATATPPNYNIQATAAHIAQAGKITHDWVVVDDGEQKGCTEFCCYNHHRMMRQQL